MSIICNKKSKPTDFAIEFLCKKIKSNYIMKDIKIFIDEQCNCNSEGYIRTCNEKEIIINAKDDTGAMYAVFDIADEVNDINDMLYIKSTKVEPFVKKRGIKFNIPLDARTPSYSDESDSAQKNIKNMWDFSFWTQFLDQLAREKYNMVSLWTLSPFPSLVKIKEFPGLYLTDVKRTARTINSELEGMNMSSKNTLERLFTVKKMTIEQKIEFWKKVMEYANNRGIKFYIFTWNLFVFGTEGNNYGITDSQDNPQTKNFVYYGTKALFETYPLLAGIGVTSGEHMKKDESDLTFIVDTYGKAVDEYNDEHPNDKKELIQRMQFTNQNVIMDYFKKLKTNYSISFKYSMAHMFVDPIPACNNHLKNNWDPKSIPDKKIYLTVRDDDFYMFRYGDPEFARTYINNLPVNILNGFYMGPDGYTWGKEYGEKNKSLPQLFTKKMWYMISMFGQMSYNHILNNNYFINRLKCVFPNKTNELFDAWRLSSECLQKFQCTHYHALDFQWYPESCCTYNMYEKRTYFVDIIDFMECKSAPTDRYQSVSAYCSSIMNKEETNLITPKQNIDYIKSNIDKINKLIPILTYAAHDNTEYIDTVNDIIAMTKLSTYYVNKVIAAINLKLYLLGDKSQKEEDIIIQLEQCALEWKDYSSFTSKLYLPQWLTRFSTVVDPQRFNENADMDILLAKEYIDKSMGD